jgi:subtilase family serine protease
VELLEARTVPSLSPLDVQHAYGLDQVTLYDGDGNPYVGDGSGQTIAIVDAYREPNIADDLANFDAYFGIPDPPSFTEVYATGTPQGNSSWGLEIALDVEYAHAMAPGANIVLVEGRTSSLNDLLAAEDVARNYPGVATVSNSWGATDSGSDSFLDGYFTTPDGHNGVTFFAASGDTGGQHLYPAMSPNVVSVGGTTLFLAGGEYGRETGWSGSGGGTSAYESEPDYQWGVQGSGQRQGPDVAAVANPNTGVLVYDTYGSYNGFVNVGGTSAATPMWAGLIAIADEGMNLLGYDTLDGASQTLPGLYGLAVNNNYPYYDGADFNDIQTGNAGPNHSGLGYDNVTGLGTPIAYNLVPDLIAYWTSAPSPPRPRGFRDPAMPAFSSSSPVQRLADEVATEMPAVANFALPVEPGVVAAWPVAAQPLAPSQTTTAINRDLALLFTPAVVDLAPPAQPATGDGGAVGSGAALSGDGLGGAGALDDLPAAS